KMKIIIYFCIWAATWAIPNELDANDTTGEHGFSPHEGELRQQPTKDSCTGEGTGCEWAHGGGSDPSSTHPTSGNEEQGAEEESGGAGEQETYDRAGVHREEDNSTANGIRGQENTISRAAAVNESNSDGHTDQNTQTGDTGNAGQDEGATVAPESGPPAAGSNNNIGGDDETGGNGGDPSGTTAQREGEGNGNQAAEAAPGNGKDAALEGSDGSPSGDGADDEDKGSGDGEGGEVGNGREGSDNSRGQEGQSPGKEGDNSIGQSSVSTEDKNSEETGELHKDTDEDSTSNSQEDSDGAPTNDGSPKTEPSDRKSDGVENGVTQEIGPSATGKIQDKTMDVEGPSSGSRSNATEETVEISGDKDSKGPHGVSRGDIKTHGEEDGTAGPGPKPVPGDKVGPSTARSGSNSDGYNSYDLDDTSMQGDDPDSSDESHGSDGSDSEGDDGGSSRGDDAHTSDESTDGVTTRTEKRGKGQETPTPEERTTGSRADTAETVKDPASLPGWLGAEPKSLRENPKGRSFGIRVSATDQILGFSNSHLYIELKLSTEICIDFVGRVGSKSVQHKPPLEGGSQQQQRPEPSRVDIWCPPQDGSISHEWTDEDRSCLSHQRPHPIYPHPHPGLPAMCWGTSSTTPGVCPPPPLLASWLLLYLDPQCRDTGDLKDRAEVKISRGITPNYEDQHLADASLGAILCSSTVILVSSGSLSVTQAHGVSVDEDSVSVVARYQNTESKSSEERKENSESSEESKVSSEEQANEDPRDSTETEEDLTSDDGHYVSRPTGGLSRSAGKEGDDKEDDEDDSGDDTFGDEDNDLGPKQGLEGGISRLGNEEDSADTTQSREDSASREDSIQYPASDSRDLDGEDGVDSESDEHWLGGGSEGDSSHGDGSEFHEDGVQNDHPDSTRSEGGSSRMDSAGVKSKESQGDSKQEGTQDSGDKQSVESPSRKFFRKSHISEEDDRGDLEDSDTIEDLRSDSTENTNSQEDGPDQSREDSKSDSQEDSSESQSQEDVEDLPDPSSESSQEVDPSPQESSSESQEEVMGESRGDNPDATSQEDSNSSEEDILNTFSSSESESREQQADSESNESLRFSEESRESPEDDNSSSQEGLQSQSTSTESQSQESRSGEDGDSDSQDSSRSKEDSNSTESTSSSEEDIHPKNMESESRKLTMDSYHNKPMGDQDDNDCQDGY
ncbi:Dentin matrix acidic phosphoprotein 1, partial [Fukomys damarensis]